MLLCSGPHQKSPHCWGLHLEMSVKKLSDELETGLLDELDVCLTEELEVCLTEELDACLADELKLDFGLLLEEEKPCGVYSLQLLISG